MPFQSTLMEPRQSKSIINLAELLHSHSGTMVLLMTDSETAIRSAEVNLKQPLLKPLKLKSDNPQLWSNYNQLGQMLLPMHQTFSEVLKRSKSSQSQLLDNNNNKLLINNR